MLGEDKLVPSAEKWQQLSSPLLHPDTSLRWALLSAFGRSRTAAQSKAIETIIKKDRPPTICSCHAYCEPCPPLFRSTLPVSPLHPPFSFLSTIL